MELGRWRHSQPIVSSPYKDLSDIGSPRADDHEFPGATYNTKDPIRKAFSGPPPSPDNVLGSEEPERHHFRPDYSSPRAYPEEDDDEDPEEDPINYPADGGDDGDDEMDIEENEDDDMTRLPMRG
ncbi:hypothetical protein Tco_0553809 [Tanacetum coccineum]